MSRKFAHFFASLAAAAALSYSPTIAQAGGGCGCEPTSTVCHVHYRGHYCRCAPPVGMVVPSSSVMGAPMMAPMMMQAPVMAPMLAPVMQAPVMSAPVMQVAAAPVQTFSLAPAQTFSLAPVQAPQASLQLNLAQPQGSAALTQDQLSQVLKALNEANSAARAPARSAEDRLTDLENRVSTLEDEVNTLKSATKGIVDVLKAKGGE
jgi:hypothetical protein